MVGVQGVGGPSGPAPDRLDDVQQKRRRDDASGTEAARDGVSISSEAKQAAEVQRLVQLTGGQDDVRADKVAEAKAALERGDFQLENRVAEVARRLLQFFS
jgi:flagellar biosynthesis anti-sigma factor FlgM